MPKYAKTQKATLERLVKIVKATKITHPKRVEIHFENNVSLMVIEAFDKASSKKRS